MLLLTGHVVSLWWQGFAWMSGLVNPTGLTMDNEKLKFQDIAMNNSDDRASARSMEKAFLKVLDDHQGIISKICRLYCNTRVDQQDLFQEIIYHLWKSFPAFREESKSGTWVYRIALNIGMRPYRSTRVKFTSELPELPQAVHDPQEQEDVFVYLRSIKSIDRGILVLLMNGYDRKEIAAITEMSEETVNKRLTRLKQKNNSRL